MTRLRLLLLIPLLALTAWGGYLVIAQLTGNRAAVAVAKPLRPGDQELAYLQPATSGSGWQRFVEGVRYLRDSRPDLNLEVDDSNASLDQTTAVPEIGVRPAGQKHWLWIRWYKLTSDLGNGEWVKALAARNPPPLAIIGGGSSDRARDLAFELKALDKPDGPLLLITTATADTVNVEGQTDSEGRVIQLNLMEIYEGRSFRFCFTNKQMGRAVIDLVWNRDYLKPEGDSPSADVVTWLDDPYSIDLSEHFRRELRDPKRNAGQMSGYSVQYSVGDVQLPNAEENAVLTGLVDQLQRRPAQRSLLALPTVDKPARRFIRAIVKAAPLEARQLVVVTGDSINFNTVFRDRDTAWNIQELPVSLVFFCHANPLNPKAKGTGPIDYRDLQAQDDLLLNAMIIERLVVAAFPPEDGLVAQPDALAKQLRVGLPGEKNENLPGEKKEKGFFGTRGNRRGGSGEFVVCVRPIIVDGRVTPESTIEIWSWQAEGANAAREWVQKGEITVSYGKGDTGHGGQ